MLPRGCVGPLGRRSKGRPGRPGKAVTHSNSAIKPGNPAGPLWDSGGLLIGMTTAIVSPSGASAGIGFAIPVDEINRYVPEIIKHGKVTRPGLGVPLATDPKTVRQVGTESGGVVRSLVKEDPADTA